MNLTTCFTNVGKKTFDKTQKRIKMTNEAPVNSDTSIDESYLNSPLFRPRPTMVAKVISVIKQLKNGNAYGLDGIPTHFIKDSVHVTACYITIIINTSVVTGIYPDYMEIFTSESSVKKKVT